MFSYVDTLTNRSQILQPQSNTAFPSEPSPPGVDANAAFCVGLLVAAIVERISGNSELVATFLVLTAADRAPDRVAKQAARALTTPEGRALWVGLRDDRARQRRLSPRITLARRCHRRTHPSNRSGSQTDDGDGHGDGDGDAHAPVAERAARECSR